MGNEYYNNSVTVSRQTAPQQTTETGTYYEADYDIPYYYYPAANFSLLVWFIGFILIAAAIQFAIIIGTIFFVVISKKNTVKCPHCGKIIKTSGKIKRHYCTYCGESLDPPKCP